MKILLLIILTSCAIKHHVQMGDIDRPLGKKLQPFDIKVSETGVNLKQASEIVSSVTKDNKRAEKIQEIISLFQMGPRTGNLIFNEKYADIIPKLVLKKCPSGNVTGLLLIRETNSYPVISGEIIRITGFCAV